MDTEFEATFIDIDPALIREKLRGLGAYCLKPETLMRRTVFHPPAGVEGWLYDGVEITIDTWPGLEPFVEIEGPSEKAVCKVSSELGLDYAQALFGAVDVVYEKKLGIPPNVINMQTPEITFENPPKKYLTPQAND